MKALLIAATLASLISGQEIQESRQHPVAPATYLGFDRNDYPGDANLKALRQTFAYTGYWLNNPPGSKKNSWTGKRETLEAAGFGFLVLFNGRTYAEIKSAGDAVKLGRSDAGAAVSAARAQGFPNGTVIFLDQEQGGRLLPEHRAYLHAWVDRVSAQFEAGVYCSGISAKEDSGASIITAEDIRNNAGERKIKYWVVNDSCPPSPGCTRPARNLSPGSSGISFADVWQFAQSPRRKDFAARCTASYNTDSYNTDSYNTDSYNTDSYNTDSYNKDGNCYPPGIGSTGKIHVDLDLATSDDPSHGRTNN